MREMSPPWTIEVSACGRIIAPCPASCVQNLDVLRMPVVVVASHDLERIRVHDERAVHFGDVEEVEAARSGTVLLQRGPLVVDRLVAHAVEPVLARVERNGAAKVDAFAVGGGDRSLRMDEEEATGEVQDRRVVRGAEAGEDVGLLAGEHRSAKTLDLEDAGEARQRSRELGGRDHHASHEAHAQQLAALDAGDEPALDHAGVRVQPDHGCVGSKHWCVSGSDQGGYRSMPGPRIDVPTTVSTR